MSLHKVHTPQTTQVGLHQQQQPQEPHATQGHYGGYTYRAGRQSQGGTQGGRRLPLTPRRNARRASQAQNQGAEDMFDQDMGGHDKDEHQRPFDPVAAMQMMGDGKGDKWHGGQGQPGSGGRGKEASGDSRKLRCSVSSTAPRHDNLPQRMLQWGLAGVAELFGARPAGPVSAMDLVGALASVVLGVVRKGTGAGPGAPTLTRVMLVAAQAQLSRQGPLPPALTLADIKSLLIARQREAWGGEPLAANRPESAGDVLALLPVLALNTARPRTAAQRQNALDRQSFILRTRGL